MAWPIKPLVYIALPVLSICAATIYYFHIKDKEWEEYLKKLRKKELEVKIPLSSVGSLIGKAGSNIKELQEKTNTKIHFKTIEGEKNFKICVIKGEKEHTEAAKKLILDFVYPKDIETSEMWVPQSVCGRIIGRCGENITKISQSTNTKIVMDKNRESLNKKLIMIKGKSPNVAAAKEAIEIIIKEEETYRKELARSNQSKSPRMKAKSRKGNDTENVNRFQKCERLMTESGDIMIQVYVSSVASPSHFWLQLITPRAVDLDHLVDNMTEYYNKEENRKTHTLSKVRPGQIVASRFEHDNKWYRVEVFSIEIDETNMGKSKVDVFYLDYGDSAYYPLEELYELHDDFFDLKFQAIEVSMAGIRPKNGGDEWEPAATEAFEDMVYSAQWKVMLAKITGYKERYASSTTREVLIPMVKLYNPDGTPGADIAKVLVEKGFAVEVETEEPLEATEEPEEATEEPEKATEEPEKATEEPEEATELEENWG